ncbi:MAG TPA: response regulator transcription factor [Drouetiella sp.]
MSSSPYKILLVDDHPVTRLGLKFMLEEFDEIVISGEANNATEAFAMFEELQPDLVLMDVDMPDVDGIETARRIKSAHPSAKIVMMTSSREEQHIFASLVAGASGYCTKEISPDRLVAAIKSVMNGDMWLDSTIAGSIMKLIPEPEQQKTTSQSQLSEREIAVLKLIGDGLSNAQIGKKLFISAETVKTHIKNILDKLSATDRTQAAVKALKQGLI